MPEVIFEKRDNIAFITLNRPESLNAMNNALRSQLEESWERVNKEDDIFVVILSGAGDRAFSAGADLKEMATRDPNARSVPIIGRGDILVWKPIIAAIHGYCVGGGLEMAMACDIRIASEDAAFGLPEVRATGGLPGGGGIQRLPRMIPMGMALELLFTGDRIPAQEAYRLGLVNRVVPRDELMSTAETLAKKICENSPSAVRALKQAVIRGVEMPFSEGIALDGYLSIVNRNSEDAKERSAAIAEKRKPVWKGK